MGRITSTSKICDFFEKSQILKTDFEIQGMLGTKFVANAMAKQNSPQVGHFYHVYNRGNNHQLIFFERENYLYFLRLIRQSLINSGVDVAAYCLMPNHYHLLVYLQADILTEAMKSLSLSYTKAINKRFDRVGALFQGRFQRILVTHAEYLIALTRYIHLNPVKADLVERPEDWEFSSYLEYAGLRKGNLPRLEWVKEQIQDELTSQRFAIALTSCF